MLILTRKKNQTIHIGDEISITVIRVSDKNVRIGVDAPKDVRVMRLELEDERPPVVSKLRPKHATRPIASQRHQALIEL